MSFKNSFILTLTFFLISCGEEIKSKVESVDKKQDTSNVSTIKKEDSSAINDLVEIRFKEFVIEVDNLEIWDNENELKETQADTAKVFLELGASIEGKKIKFKPFIDSDFKVYQRFENSVTIMNEGPHCDLTEWKHYDSEWKELQINDGEFLTDSYSESDREKFVAIDMNDLRKAVKEECGEFWAEHIQHIKSPTEYPAGVGTSRFFLKIEFSTQNNDVLNEKIISFEIPMGC